MTGTRRDGSSNKKCQEGGTLAAAWTVTKGKHCLVMPVDPMAMYLEINIFKTNGRMYANFDVLMAIMVASGHMGRHFH